MPIQTTLKDYIYFPDGAKVSVKESGAGSYTDLGAISTAVTATLNYDINEIETANAGKLDRQAKNMTIAGGFTLINLDPAGVEKLGSGILEVVTTAATPTTTVSDQIISSGSWADKTAVNLSLLDSSVSLRATAEPTITSVTGSVDGALVADDDYSLVVDSNSPSGYSIVLNLAGTALTTIVQDVTIDYNSVTPVANTKVYAGSSTQVLSAYAMKIEHTDSNSLVRSLELYAVSTDSGGFQFNFKGANEEGVEEMPLAFTAQLDTTLTDGRQLMVWSVDANAS
jgi:hypothetical protein